jgi:hypothetical protein
VRHAALAAAAVRDDDAQLAAVRVKLDVAVPDTPCPLAVDRGPKLLEDVYDRSRSVSDLLQYAPGEIVEQAVDPRLIRNIQGELEWSDHPMS